MNRRKLHVLLVALPAAIDAGCTLPPRHQALREYIASDPTFHNLPGGPERIDALFIHAVDLTGSDREALRLLGSIAAYDGTHLAHPFDTPLTCQGPLALVDKTTHFFAQAWFEYQDCERLIPLAAMKGFCWECLGEFRSWFTDRSGFNWLDIWANHLGREYGRRVYRNRGRPAGGILPSTVLTDIERFKPRQVSTRSNAAAADEADPSNTRRRISCRAASVNAMTTP